MTDFDQLMKDARAIRTEQCPERRNRRAKMIERRALGMYRSGRIDYAELSEIEWEVTCSRWGGCLIAD